MILEIVMWGFFSAWGWIGANYVKDQIWPPEPTPVVIQEEKKNKKF
jgi:hypothetical protein